MKTRNIRVKLTEVEIKLLEQLLRTGLWGETIEDTLERLVAESLRTKVSPKQLMMREPR